MKKFALIAAVATLLLGTVPSTAFSQPAETIPISTNLITLQLIADGVGGEEDIVNITVMEGGMARLELGDDRVLGFTPSLVHGDPDQLKVQVFEITRVAPKREAISFLENKELRTRSEAVSFDAQAAKGVHLKAISVRLRE